MEDPADIMTLLRWHVDAGADEAISDRPVNHYHVRNGRRQNMTSREAASLPEQSTQERPTAAHAGERRRQPAASAKAGLFADDLPSSRPEERMPETRGAARRTRKDAQHDARSLAHSAESLDALAKILGEFDDCPLKKTATNLVFGDGNREARIMFVGEAPGAEEDRQGLPFVGPAGRLLDHMLAAIGLDRRTSYITNILPWRPPGNRQPTPAETSICLPFIERQIELVFPDILVLVGGVAAKTLLGRSEGITKLRGQWFEYSSPGLSRPVQARAIFHPAYLLRSPAQKREAWRDLLEIKAKMNIAP